eukprot:scaffold128194_cov19-Tisochrysis_lutea.AAC.1
MLRLPGPPCTSSAPKGCIGNGSSAARVAALPWLGGCRPGASIAGAGAAGGGVVQRVEGTAHTWLQCTGQQRGKELHRGAAAQGASRLQSCNGMHGCSNHHDTTSPSFLCHTMQAHWYACTRIHEPAVCAGSAQCVLRKSGLSHGHRRRPHGHCCRRRDLPTTFGAGDQRRRELRLGLWGWEGLQECLILCLFGGLCAGVQSIAGVAAEPAACHRCGAGQPREGMRGEPVACCCCIGSSGICVHIYLLLLVHA